MTQRGHSVAGKTSRGKSLLSEVLRVQQSIVFGFLVADAMVRQSEIVARDPELASVLVAERLRKLQERWEAVR